MFFSRWKKLTLIQAGGGHNPRMLPNNMCCPFLQTEGIPGIPYHSAIHGCCETRLYDLYTQECCADTGVVLEKVHLFCTFIFFNLHINLYENL